MHAGSREPDGAQDCALNGSHERALLIQKADRDGLVTIRLMGEAGDRLMDPGALRKKGHLVETHGHMPLHLAVALRTGDEKAVEGRIEGNRIEKVNVRESAEPTGRLIQPDMRREPVALAVAHEAEQRPIFQTRPTRFRIDCVSCVSDQFLPDRRRQNACGRRSRNGQASARIEQPFVFSEAAAAPDFNRVCRFGEARGDLAHLLGANHQRIQNVEVIERKRNGSIKIAARRKSHFDEA